ncbi:hypothetical protein PGTUg99_032834 [Puccinia graminis f. sp. tritici]|uniref:Uncharacterized protein n=1 Tax=Puccinia graminis f. sp. tritici TaxID=56615 RepID=A0A5B0NPH8_PUCGR|nr:hypothetical protein PGTUg99_032834 [Puccinia graminis f. sp. tritici]
MSGDCTSTNPQLSSQKQKEVKEVVPNETGEQALVSQNKQNKDEQKHSPVSEDKEKNEELIDTQKLSSNSRIFPENTKNYGGTDVPQ